MSSERLIYLPLGGAGEVGMNCYVYGWGKPGEERLIVLDLGVTFPDMETSPGVDLIMPDVDWLEACRDRIEAIFITHAHEDHVGAVGHLWPRLKAPIYARKFTAHIARMKMEEQGLSPEVIQTVEAWPAVVEAGPFRVGFAPISHSIPESSMMVLDTPAGRVVHTADFKVDRTPLVGEPFDEALYREIAGKGVQALICDSTNAFVQTPGRSEAVLGPEIEALVKSVRGMVVATTFASNVARVKTLAEAGRAAGRSVCLLGRAMKRMIGAASETGVLTDFPPTIEVEDAANISRENLMLIVTGSQGERRAASAQLSRGKYLGMEMKEGDLFLFSSRTIPGNEKGVIRIMNSFSELGVDVMDDRGGRYHVSGHANRPDLELMHEIMRPKILIPMHGEHMHLREHVRIGAAKGIPGAIAVNGTMLDITGAVPTIAAYEEAGRTYLDGGVLIGALDGVVRDRIRMALNGHVTVTVIVDEDDEPLGDPWCDTMGLPEKGKSKAALVEVLEEDLSQFLGRADRKTIRDEEKLDEALRKIVRNTAQNEVGKKPEVTVVVSRLS
jgi:ribonuclease J